MKADPSGTHTEQVRAMVGWVSPGERRRTRVPPGRTCEHCRHVQFGEPGPSGTVRARCCEQSHKGWATHPHATCLHWDWRAPAGAA